MERNMTANQLKESIKDFVQYVNENPDQFNSVFFYISGHVSNGNIYSADGEPLSLKKEIFIPIFQCQELKKIPKIFFIQACRRPAQSKEENELTLDDIEDSEDESQRDLLTHMPNTDNAFLLHSTSPGHYRKLPDGKTENETGSQFISILCKTFAKHAHEASADLSNLTTLENKELREAFPGIDELLLMNATQINFNKQFHFSKNRSEENQKA